MSRIERGGANPSLDAIETLAVALGVEVKTFFETAVTGAAIKSAAPVTVPFAADGSCFNPSLRRKRMGHFTVGKKATCWHSTVSRPHLTPQVNGVGLLVAP
jgi:transcriptional regulator with XRE-family HTH domain